MKILDKLASRHNDARNAAPVVIACLGDSVTHGCFEVFVNRYGDIDTKYNTQAGYVGLLKKRLDKCFPASAATVVNAGISGDNAVGGLQRLERDVLRFRPDLVTVNFGLNDAMNPDVEAGLEAYKNAMSEIFKRVCDSGAECLLVTPNLMCDYVSGELFTPSLIDTAREVCQVVENGVLDKYVNAAREQAAHFGIPVADVYSRWITLKNCGADTTDMLINHINHPAPFAHEFFVEAIWDKMLS